MNVKTLKTSTWVILSLLSTAFIVSFFVEKPGESFYISCLDFTLSIFIYLIHESFWNNVNNILKTKNMPLDNVKRVDELVSLRDYFITKNKFVQGSVVEDEISRLCKKYHINKIKEKNKFKW